MKLFLRNLLKRRWRWYWIAVPAVTFVVFLSNYYILNLRIGQIVTADRYFGLAHRQSVLLQRSGALFLLLLKTTLPEDRRIFHRELIGVVHQSQSIFQQLGATSDQAPPGTLYRIPSSTRQLVDDYHANLDRFISIPTERLPFFISNPTVSVIWRTLEDDHLSNAFNDWVELNRTRTEQQVNGFHRDILYIFLFDMGLLMIIGIVFLYLNIHKRIEEILRRANERLEERIKGNNVALERAQKELETSRRLTHLPAIVAHELRNPLAAISLATLNIRRHATDGSLNRSVTNIEKKISESDQIINNLLLYSRLQMPTYEELSVNQMIEECAQHLQDRQEAGKPLLVKRELNATEGIIIEADGVQLAEVLNNILNNAADSVPDVNGVVEIRTSTDELAIEISIKDNGCGVEKEFLEKVFEPFFTTKRKGTGLGLAICKQIIELHQGQIRMDSIPLQGTCVTITLPRAKS